MSQAALSSFAATPGDLRRIVLSYLCDNCYADTARVFARDSATRELNKDGDEVLMSGEDGVLDAQVLRIVQLRKEISLRLLSGRIDEATELLNLHFSDVLSPSGRIRDTPRHDPSHLFLNLRIQNFIEKSRTMPLPWPSDILLSSNPPTPATKLCSLDDSSLFQTESLNGEERKNRLLGLMHELYTLTHALSVPMDRETYLRELSTVGGLLAYPIPEKSREMRKYLDMGRREAVADQMNDAILCRARMARPSVVEICARHTTLVFSTLHDLEQKLPPPDRRPSDVDAILSGVTKTPAQVHETDDPKATKTKDPQNSEQPVPKFELKNLLGPEPT